MSSGQGQGQGHSSKNAIQASLNTYICRWFAVDWKAVLLIAASAGIESLEDEVPQKLKQFADIVYGSWMQKLSKL